MYIINQITFNPHEHQIQHNNVSVQLNPKASELLQLFAERANQTLTREEILSTIWSRDYVSDHSLTQAISDLRKALSELGLEHKKLIVTRPRVGYMLEATVKQQDDSELPVPKEATAETKPVNRKSLFAFAGLSALITVISFALILWLPTENPVTQTTIDPFKVAFITFESNEEYQHLAFGLSDLINYRINQQGHYRSSLIYDRNNGLTTRSALVMSGKIAEKAAIPTLSFYIDDNMSGKRVFEQSYSIANDVIADVPKTLLADIESVMEIPFDQSIIVKLDRQYPSDVKNLNLIHQAHYASNIITTRSLYSAIKLYDEVLKQDPTLEIASAERLISAHILTAIQPGSISSEELKFMTNSLLSINDELHAPIYYEALAISQFDKRAPSLAKSQLQNALKIRESWTSNIIAGKIAEAESKPYLAKSLYQRAYAMKPDDSTLRVIEHLLISSDLPAFELR